MRTGAAGEWAVQQPDAREENSQSAGGAAATSGPIRTLRDGRSPFAILALEFRHAARMFLLSERPRVGQQPRSWSTPLRLANTGGSASDCAAAVWAPAHTATAVPAAPIHRRNMTSRTAYLLNTCASLIQMCLVLGVGAAGDFKGQLRPDSLTC